MKKTQPIYRFHDLVGYYMPPGDLAMEDPEEPGRFLVPAFTTIICPPTFNEDEIPVIDSLTNPTKWNIEKNFVGKTIYNLTTQEELVVDKIGEILPEYTLKPVPDPKVIYSWSIKDDNWIIDIDKLRIALCSLYTYEASVARFKLKNAWTSRIVLTKDYSNLETEYIAAIKLYEDSVAKVYKSDMKELMELLNNPPTPSDQKYNNCCICGAPIQLKDKKSDIWVCTECPWSSQYSLKL